MPNKEKKKSNGKIDYASKLHPSRYRNRVIRDHFTSHIFFFFFFYDMIFVKQKKWFGIFFFSLLKLREIKLRWGIWQIREKEKKKRCKDIKHTFSFLKLIHFISSTLTIEINDCNRDPLSDYTNLQFVKKKN